ncbi:MAG: hypothetical protein Q9165_006618 [Trypethelium subeluteriae]
MAPGPSFSSFWTQFFPPKPQFTEKDVPNLQGKVYIVTGSNTGIGKELACMLFGKNAKVYIAARSEDKARKAIDDIQKVVPVSKGSLIFLKLDLSDLANVKSAAQSFLAQEQQLHVLFNNAGVMVSPTEPPLKTAQGHELGLGVNCIGTFLFTRLLTPTLSATAKAESGAGGTVRVVWLSSFGLELFAHESVGVSLDNLDYHIPKPATDRYGISKCGAWALAVEFAKRHKADGIISVPVNPGNLRSELPRDQGTVLKIVAKLLGYPVVNGAYTELFAGLSPQVTLENSDWSRYWTPNNAMSPAQSQTAILQSQETSSTSHTLPLAVAHSLPVPDSTSANYVVIRVLAVALNPTDHKMVTHYPSPGKMVGCDFCGVIEKSNEPNSDGAAYSVGTRVCGGVFPYASTEDSRSGAFAEWVVADVRLLLRVPDQWDDLQAAALGGVGWGTVALAMSDPDALALEALPSMPTTEKEPVLVYGGATATGTMACQLLKL